MLPYIHSDDDKLNKMQTTWGSQLNPLLAAPLSSTVLLKNVVLAPGSNTINHLLGRVPQGWFVVDVTNSVTIYRSQPFNNLTLTLTSSGATTVSLMVF